MRRAGRCFVNYPRDRVYTRHASFAPLPALTGALQFTALLAQAFLVMWLVFKFRIGSVAFIRLMALAFAGFVVNHFLPHRFRLPFFVLLSLFGIAVVFGPVGAAWLVGAGGAMIGMAHLPIPFRARIALLAVVLALMVALRARWLPTPWPTAIWPILGSMFMFRLAVYL